MGFLYVMKGREEKFLSLRSPLFTGNPHCAGRGFLICVQYLQSRYRGNSMIHRTHIVLLSISIMVLCASSCKTKPEPCHLYCIDSDVNIREQPDLRSKRAGRLSLYEKVECSEKTGTPMKLKFRGRDYNCPWYRIKTARGITGWVYGVFLHEDLFTHGEKINKSGIYIVAWSRDDKVAIVQGHANYMGDEPVYSFHLCDLKKNVYYYNGDRQHIGFHTVLKYLSETRSDFPKITDDFDFSTYYSTHYYRNALNTFLYHNRYFIHDMLSSGKFKPAGPVTVMQLPVHADNELPRIVVEKRHKKSYHPGLMEITAYDLYAVGKREKKKIFSVKLTGAAIGKLIYNVTVKGYLKNPLTGRRVLLIEESGEYGHPYISCRLAGINTGN